MRLCSKNEKTENTLINLRAMLSVSRKGDDNAWAVVIKGDVNIYWNIQPKEKHDKFFITSMMELLMLNRYKNIHFIFGGEDMYVCVPHKYLILNPWQKFISKSFSGCQQTFGSNIFKFSHKSLWHWKLMTYFNLI